MKTTLVERDLWYDGDSSFDESALIDAIRSGKLPEGHYVRTLSDEVKKFNRLVPREEQLTVKTSCHDLDLSWNLSEEIMNLDVEEYLAFRLTTLHLPVDEHNGGIFRIVDELQLYKKLNLFPVLRAIIHVIYTLERNKIVWGVGRGSCVSSYVLYLIGVHDVDSMRYGLDITDFLRAT